MRKRNRRFHVETLEQRALLDASDVVISEFLAVNENSIRDEDGDRSDWLELHNTGGEPADLEGLVLQAGGDQWRIPEVVLSPFETLVIFASGKDRTTGELHTNFQLSREGETLALLTADGQAIHQYDPYPFQTPNVSYGIEMSVGRTSTLLQSDADARYLVPTREIGLGWTEAGFDDSSWTAGQTGIGYETSGSNYAPFLNSRVPSGTVGFYARIPFDVSDVAAISQLTLNMRYDDGFIAYVNGQRVADGNGPASPTFRSTSTGENSDGDAVVFEPFDISVAKNLLNSTGNVLAIHGLNRSTGSSDMLMMPEVRFARAGASDTSEVGFFTAPTPGGNNGQPIDGFTSEVTISLPHGFYDSPQQLTLSTEDADATIRYTTDGSEPTSRTGTVYSGPVSIEQTTIVRAAAFKDDLVPTSVATASYFFVSDVVQQSRTSTLDEGFPSSWRGTSSDYGLDPDVIGPNDDFGGKYADSIQDDLQAIPTLSIAIDVDDMFGTNGIYSNPTNSNLEKAASLELIHPDGSDGFQIDAGLKIQGGAFRSFGLTKKKSFRFKFQSEYGPAKLEYPLFGDNAVDSFDTITLRMEANDGWQWSNGDNTNRLYGRDEWGRRTQIAMGQPGSHGTFGHVYINGVYWGTYNVVERPDEAFASDYIGGDKEDWDVQNSGRAINGDLQSWQDLVRTAQEVDDAPDGSGQQVAAWMRMQGLSADGTDDPRFEDLLDVDNYIDYLIINMFGGNSDWPHKNYYAGRQRGPDSTGYKFFMWDAEWSLNLRSDVNTNRTNIADGIAAPYAELRRVPEFQLRFADRVQKHFSPGGALYVDPVNTAWDPEHPERNVPAARFVEITDIMRSPLVAESARWGDQHGRPQTVDESWEPQVEFMLDSYFPRRSAVVLRQFDRAGLMSDVSTPEFSQQGGPAGTVTLSSDEGQIYYTTDGSDPRLVGGDLSPTAVRYRNSISITGDTQIRVRALQNGEWSAINEAQFIAESVPASADNLAITEIHFNPQAAQPGEPDEDNDEFEFIEVTNIGSSVVDLTGVRFVETDVDGDTDGIRFDFSPQTLAPNESIVVVENVDAFVARYGDDVRIAAGQDMPLDTQGQYGGKLSNGGETVTLLDASDQVIRQLTYDDWYEATDGNGRSLEITDVNEQRSDQLSSEQLWAASASDGGTPGVFGVEEVFGDLNGDLRANRADVDLLYNAIDANENTPELDLNDDGQTDSLDAQTLIVDVIGITQGDVDFDGDVDFVDFLAFSANFGKTGQTWFDGDFNGDGAITFEDMLLLSAFFGTSG